MVPNKEILKKVKGIISKMVDYLYNKENDLVIIMVDFNPLYRILTDLLN